MNESSLILRGDIGADICLIQPVGEYDAEKIDEETGMIRSMVPDKKLAVAGVYVTDSNKELSPWKAPAVFHGGEAFGDGAGQTLDRILSQAIPGAQTELQLSETVRYIIGGYSLAGLFALWAGYQTDLFDGVVAVSPSVWFPNWEDFISNHKMQAKKVYLSLGEKEAKTRNPVLATVANRIHLQHDRLTEQLGEDNCILEWNPGNHFEEPDRRKAKGFGWMLESR